MRVSQDAEAGEREDLARARLADALAGALRRESAGRLSAFVGAAPGVGKTYAMLQRARELRRQGVDVVIGVVETHGRSETGALLEGLPRVPMRQVEYRGRTLEEMDLDAVLARRPAMVVVDELAHRNAPGSRHERRWQDVMELLDLGIDVSTTMNVQHFASLNDVIHQITGVRVRETVPEAVFERLCDIRLVDLPPRELIERLRQGKVYLPEQAAHAMQAFFTPGNLAALRELAMQTVADFVDADLREARLGGTGATGPLRRHVLVAIDGHGQSEMLVRAGCRIAERRGAPWSVVAVDDGSEPALTAGEARSNERQRGIDRAFTLARSLGGATATRYGDDVAGALLDEAAAREAATIVLGRPRRRLVRMKSRNVVAELLARDGPYEVTVVAMPRTVPEKRAAVAIPLPLLRWDEAALACGVTATTAALAWLAERIVGLDDLSMIFIVAVLLVGARTRMAPAVLTAVLCFLAYNFFFIEPRFTFFIAAYTGIATVVIFLAAALVAGRLASRLRGQVLALRAANSHVLALQALGRDLGLATDEAAVLAAARAALDRELGAQVWIALHEDTPGDADFGDKDLAAAHWCRRHGKPAGRYTDTLGSAARWFVPLRSEDSLIGVVGLRFAPDAVRLGAERQRLAEAMIADIGEALARTRLVSELEAARVNEETERLRSALLSSVSHDLRSPLSSIIGAADSLTAYADRIPDDERQSLYEVIAHEGHRLDRYIQNLLDMTRLGHDGLTLVRDWIGIDELIGAAATRLRRYSPAVHIEVALASGLPLLQVHPALIEQALFNVLENACKFSPQGAPIVVTARRAGTQVYIDVSDSGPGIPEVERTRIFDMFHCVEGGDRKRHGSGLGLAIVKAIVGAHMGTVEALPGPNGQGTTVRISLPATEGGVA